MRVINLFITIFTTALFAVAPSSYAAAKMIQTELIETEMNDVVPESSSAEPENAEEPELNFLSSPQIRIQGEVIYVSGGIGQEELKEMKSMVNEYTLEVVFVEKTKAGKEGYISDAKVQISDLEGNILLDTYTNGPILLVDLPKGKYQVIAEYNNIFKANRIKIDDKKNQRVVFLWPVQAY